MIIAKDIKKAYFSGKTRIDALKGVNLEIEKGSLVAITGTSGSGKTTLLNIIGGLDRKFSGEVLIQGMSIRNFRDQELSLFRNKTIGFVFQAFHLIPHMTVAENVSLPSLFGMISGDIEKKIQDSLERVSLLHKEFSNPTQLSAGEKQRVAIARALFNSPSLILCDEPTGNLDEKTGESIIDLFESLNKNDGITFVIVTHEKKVSERAKKIIKLENGIIVNS
jgi:putative ABC transport system ATP-binding protein